VDRHPYFRRSLTAFLEAVHGVSVAGEFGSCEEALRCLESDQPDIVFMDVVMSEAEAAAACRVIRDHHPETTVILYGFSRPPSSRTGRCMFVLKDRVFEELPALIALVREHGTAAGA